jgi:hypothetical protein
MPLTITEWFTDIPSTLSATFAPGDNFDWMPMLGASGQEMAGDAFCNADLSHGNSNSV